MKICEPLVISLEERAVSWVSLAGSPGVQRHLHQGCLAAEPSGQSQQTLQHSCKSDGDSLFRVFENDGLVSLVWSRCFLHLCCKPAIPHR